MKKICSFFVAVCILALLMGCGKKAETDDGYKLICENGHYYVDMNLDPKPTSDGVLINPIGGALIFHSLDELVYDFQNGNFSEEELEQLTRFVRRTEDGKVPVPNLSELKEPIVPKSLGAYEISVSGPSANGFTYRNPEGAEKAYFVVIEQGEYEDFVEEFTNYQEDHADEDFFFSKQNPERNAMEYYWKSNGGKNIKHILYTLAQNEIVYYVREEYDADTGALDYVYIWFANDGMYAHICVHVPEQRPSEEWITSFGVKPYES